MSTRKFTLAHVTHEAVEQLGGIGAVLEGLMISPVYQEHVKRSILVGPTSTQMAVDPEARLGEHGQVLYSSIDNIDRVGLKGKLRPVEWAFNVGIVYGRRRYNPPGENRSGESEVLLIDVFRVNHNRLNVFKFHLWETFGVDSGIYEKSWDFEEYVRLAEPAFYALQALLHPEDLPCILFSHEFMGMPTVLQAIREGQKQFRTVFHAHECSTARRLVEDHPGHDTMFYNVLHQARAQGQYVEDVFGSMGHFFRHGLVSRTHLCDGLIAVGDCTREELQFLDPHFDNKPIDLVYNGVPAMKVDLPSKLRSRRMLLEYSTSLLGSTPDVLMTHVTRPVISKGLWRDLRVCHELDALLAEQKKTAVLYILTTAGGTRRPQDVVHMERLYGWPRKHRLGYPDLVGPEVEISHDVDQFNQFHKAVQVVLINQFGFSPARVGSRVPPGMNLADFRRATDVEFGMATYEPFGISPLEPLGSGAICVISSVCGCKGFVDRVTQGKGTPNVIVADFTKLDHPMNISQLKVMSRTHRDQIEAAVAADVARQLMEVLPKKDRQREALIESGQALVGKMGWDQVIDFGLLPMLDRIKKMPSGNGDLSK